MRKKWVEIIVENENGDRTLNTCKHENILKTCGWMELVEETVVTVTTCQILEFVNIRTL